MEGYPELLAAARAATGLEDFGNDSFLEGLEILVRALRDEARLNADGDAVLRQKIIGHLKQRLQIEDWYRRHPEIDEGEIKAPLIGIGLPRTGSTALSFLLGQDPNTRSLRTWEASEPCPPPSTVKGPDPRYAAAEAMQERMTPAGHLPQSPDGPTECLELMALDFKSYTFQAMARVPSYAEWMFDADFTSTYLYERRVLKLLQWGEPAKKPWRLKAPNHQSHLDHLDRAFPNARFVMTHRDPTDVLISVCHLYGVILERFTDKPDMGYVGKLNVDQWSLSIDRALKFRDSGNDGRFYDIHFRAMQRDPVGQVKGLYAWLGEPVTPAFENGMARWWKENAENREANVHPDPAVYGVDLDRVRGLFATYAARMAAWTKT